MTPRMPMQFNIVAIPTCESTNAELKRQLADGTTCVGTILTCPNQTKGRGRRDRQWVSPKGNLALSVALPLPAQPDKSFQWGLVVGLCLVECISTFLGLPVLLKWPNDILLDNRKVAGILSEAVFEKMAVIVGVGLNLNSVVQDFPAYLQNQINTIKSHLKHETCEKDFMAAFVKQLQSTGDLFSTQGLKALSDRIDAKLAWKNSDVVVSDGGSESIGKFLGLDDQGYLRLLSPTGQEEKIMVGDVSVRKS